jgi:hypothetical protein
MKRQLSIRDVRLLSPQDKVARVQCNICHEVLREPRSCHLGHLFCRGCIERWLVKHATCPVDRSSLTVQALVVPALAKELTGRLKVASPNEAVGRRKGCPWTGVFDEIEGHMKVCEFRIVPCKWCKKKKIAAATEAHALKCNLRLVECKLCHSSVKARDLASHLNGPCPVSPTGKVHCFCGVTVKRKDEEAHLSESLGRHLRVQQEQVAAQERRLKAEMQAQHQRELGALQQQMGANVTAVEARLQSEINRHYEELQELRRTVSMAATTTLVWTVRVQADASLVQKSETFLFGGISLFFECKWWVGSGECSLSVRPVAKGGPVMYGYFVFSTLGRTINVLVSSGGKSAVKGVWTAVDAEPLVVSIPTGVPGTLHLELKRR